jgi:hypothetical protein
MDFFTADSFVTDSFVTESFATDGFAADAVDANCCFDAAASSAEGFFAGVEVSAGFLLTLLMVGSTDFDCVFAVVGFDGA